MDTPAVTLACDESGQIATLSLNRPDRFNALGFAVVDGLSAAAHQLARMQDLRCAIVTGNGKAFCSGADLKERQGMDQEQIISFVTRMRDAMNRVADLPFPTIAAVHGLALGGGCELALACDIRILHHAAMIGLTETSWAIMPGAGGTQRLPLVVGPAKARELIFTASRLGAGEALSIGLANRVVQAAEGGADPQQAVLMEAMAMARQIAANGPIGVRQAKRALQHSLGGAPLQDGLVFEWECYLQVLPTQDRLEGLAAFNEKRPPRYKGE